MAYAEGTTVPESKSRGEVEALLRKHGAGAMVVASDETRVIIRTVHTGSGWHLEFTLPLPTVDDFPAKGRNNKAIDREARVAKERRRRWRALLLCLKAKFEAIETGITTFEEEFLAHTIVPETDKPFGPWATQQLHNAYKGLPGPMRLPGLPG